MNKSKTQMTPNQKKLARQALGLPNSRNQSIQNRFIAEYKEKGDYQEWDRMSQAGFAERSHIINKSGTRPSVRFWLTEAGARAALNEGEKLSNTDFPLNSP